MDTNLRYTSTNLPPWARIREPLRWDEILDELENEIPVSEGDEATASQKQANPDIPDIPEKIREKSKVS